MQVRRRNANLLEEISTLTGYEWSGFWSDGRGESQARQTVTLWSQSQLIWGSSKRSLLDFEELKFPPPRPVSVQIAAFSWLAPVMQAALVCLSVFLEVRWASARCLHFPIYFSKGGLSVTVRRDVRRINQEQWAHRHLYRSGGWNWLERGWDWVFGWLGKGKQSAGVLGRTHLLFCQLSPPTMKSSSIER